MTFAFLDKVTSIIGNPVSLVADARARLFREPVRHEGLRRLPRAEVRAHVAGVVIRAANARLREPLMAALREHAEEAGGAHEMTTGDEPGSAGYREAVIAAFAGNDVGLDPAAFATGEFTAGAAADQVLTVPDDAAALDAILKRAGVALEAVDAIVDEILAPAAPVEWSLATLAEVVLQSAERGGAMCAASGGLHATFAEETLRYLLCETAPELRATGIQMLDLNVTDEALNAWLDERAMTATPESDEADVAEVLRLVNEEGGGSHTSNSTAAVQDDAGNMTAAGAEPGAPAPAATPMRPVAAEPSNVTRATAGALKALFELTKESDTNVAKVLGVDKAVVAQSRKGVTPWAPNGTQFEALFTLVTRYSDGLNDARGALEALDIRGDTRA